MYIPPLMHHLPWSGPRPRERRFRLKRFRASTRFCTADRSRAKLNVMKLTRASRWKSLITCIVLAVHLGPASAAPAEQIAEFVSIAKAQVRTDEAAAALRDGCGREPRC